MIKKSEYYGRDLEAMSFAVNYHLWIIDSFKEYFGEIVAEIGAGMGGFSKLLIKESIKRLVLFEPSINMYPLLEDHFKEDKRVETVQGYLCNEYQKYEKVFDSVIYVNVLEHIKNDKNELIIAHKSLKKGGFLLIFVPALPCLYSDFDKKIGHFRRYNKKRLRKLIKTTGFQLINIKYFDLIGILPWYVILVLLKKEVTPANTSLYDRMIVPFMRKIESSTTIPVGKNLILIAKKN